MQIVFYQNTIPKSHIARTLTNPLAVTGEPREDDVLDVLNPVIMVKYADAILLYNFVYIAKFNRYYHITDMVIMGKQIQISMHVDVLYTYRSIILSSQCIAERSSSLYDVMVEDSAVTSTAGYVYTARSLPYKFRPDHGTYVLMVAGGE